jgi:hypothetical protein
MSDFSDSEFPTTGALRDMEEWRPIPGFEDRYEVSSLGNVCGLRGRNGKGNYRHPLSPSKVGPPPNFAYRQVQLWREGKPSLKFVHRLVLEAFVSPCPPGMEGAHLDGNPSNNMLSNLAWTTHLDNMRHKYRHGTMPVGEKNWRARFTADDVREIRRMAERGLSNAEIGRLAGTSKDAIWMIVNRRSWRHI